VNYNREIWGIGAYDSVLYHCTYDVQKQKWGAWESNFNNAGGLRFDEVFGTTNGWNNNLELFAIDVRGVLYHSWWQGSWRPWEYSLNGKDPFKELDDGFCICDKAHNPNVVLFGTRSGMLFYNYFNGQWQSWSDFNPVPGITSITGAYDGSGTGWTLLLFAVDQDNSLHSCHSTGVKDNALTWSGWEKWTIGEGQRLGM
jgi:hypothetical protein